MNIEVNHSISKTIPKSLKFRACKNEIESYHTCILNVAEKYTRNNADMFDHDKVYLCEPYLNTIQSCMKRIERT